MSEIAHIDCGWLATVQAFADRQWTDPIKNIDLKADVGTAKAVQENQSVRFEELTGRKKKVVSLEWLTACELELEGECTDDCEITGSDAEPVCKEYEIECLNEVSFEVPERAYRERTIEMQESIAFNLGMAKKLLDNYIAQYLLACLLFNAGVNVYDEGVGDVQGTLTYIAAQYWDDSIWGYFDLVARLNKFNSPYGITGTNLYQLIFNRTKEVANADGKGNYAKMNTVRMYLDPENVEVIAPHSTFLIHKTALAFINKAWYPVGAASAELRAGIYHMWSEPSNNLPGVYYDIIMQEKCSSNEFYQAYKVQLHGLCALNPLPCDETNTGILVFECGENDN
jgi:hypothetical protein